MKNLFKIGLLAASVIALVALPIQAADITRDIAGGVSVGPMTIAASTATNINLVVPCTTGQYVSVGIEWQLSDSIASTGAGASNMTFMIQQSHTGSKWTMATASGAAGGSGPLMLMGPYTFNAMVLATNNVGITNFTVGGVPFLRIPFLTNGAAAVNATNVFVRVFVK